MKINPTLLAVIAMAAMFASEARAVFVRTPPPAPRSVAVIRKSSESWIRLDSRLLSMGHPA